MDSYKHRVPQILHWARVVGCRPFALYVIYKERLCPSSEDINWLMMMINVGERFLILIEIK
jgi:hypothetical protein